MGGIGSGRIFHYSTRSYTDDYLDLDIRTINQRGWLHKTTYQNLTWKRNNQEIGSIQFLVRTRVKFPDKPNITLKYKSQTNGGDWQELDYKVKLEVTKCNYGGLRYWFKCPECNKRVCVLYAGAIFKCRTCHDLVHKSRNESTIDQATRRLNKAKKKLNPMIHQSIFDSVQLIDKPKWIRYKTFYYMKKQLETLEEEVYQDIKSRFGCSFLL